MTNKGAHKKSDEADPSPWFDQFRDAKGKVDLAKSRKALIMRDFDFLHAVNTDIGWPPHSRIVAVREMSEPNHDITADMAHVDACRRVSELRAALELDQTMVLAGFMLEAPYDPITGYTMWSWGWLSLVAVPRAMDLSHVRSKVMSYDRAKGRGSALTYSISEADSPRQLFQHLSEIADMEVFFYKDVDSFDETQFAIVPETAIAQGKALRAFIPEDKRSCFFDAESIPRTIP